MLPESHSFAKVLASLSTETLCTVLTELFARPVEQISRRRLYRAKDVREDWLGGVSPAYWAELRAKGLIKPGTQISPGIELFTEEQILEMIARLAEHEAARKEAERNAKAEAVLQEPPQPPRRPGPRSRYLRPVPDRAEAPP